MYRIINRYGHYEVRDDQGRFVLSADTDSEAAMQIEMLYGAKVGVSDTIRQAHLASKKTLTRETRPSASAHSYT